MALQILIAPSKPRSSKYCCVFPTDMSGEGVGLERDTSPSGQSHHRRNSWSVVRLRVP
jgi:hypothetical protein